MTFWSPRRFLSDFLDRMDDPAPARWLRFPSRAPIFETVIHDYLWPSADCLLVAETDPKVTLGLSGSIQVDIRVG